ncbi:IS3 family transposase, partial [Lactiplantibacillus pentosus]|uniref:IS3 family transposase n=1 Tax=Lactiplantibacillus pentosus TaxID=1589 RepID=UPI0021E91EF6
MNINENTDLIGFIVWLICSCNLGMESFHASLKKECVYPVPVFEDYETAAAVLFEYVHAFYNRKRIHSSLGYQTPLQV